MASIRVRATQRTEYFNEGEEFDLLESDLSSTRVIINYRGRAMTVGRHLVELVPVKKKPTEIDYSDITRKISGG